MTLFANRSSRRSACRSFAIAYGALNVVRAGLSSFRTERNLRTFGSQTLSVDRPRIGQRIVVAVRSNASKIGAFSLRHRKRVGFYGNGRRNVSLQHRDFGGAAGLVLLSVGNRIRYRILTGRQPGCVKGCGIATSVDLSTGSIPGIGQDIAIGIYRARAHGRRIALEYGRFCHRTGYGRRIISAGSQSSLDHKTALFHYTVRIRLMEGNLISGAQ